MVWEVYQWGQKKLGNQKKAADLARAWALLTEGLYKEGDFSREVNEALKTGKVSFTLSGKEEMMWEYDRAWGNKWAVPILYWCKPSKGDVAANLAGSIFYHKLSSLKPPKKFDFDICSPEYGVTKKWLEPPATK